MSKKTILIVDDSPTDREHLATIARQAGFEVQEASSGADGVIKTKSLLPSVVVMDIVMPGMNGFQATKTITHDDLTKHIPVIIVSNKNQETDRLWGLRNGAKAYMVKPVDAIEFTAQLRTLASQA